MNSTQKKKTRQRRERNEDLRIPATPEKLARAVIQGGVKLQGPVRK